MGQGYSNDVFNRNLVLGLFLVYYLYIRFLFSQLQRNKNWKGVKCNPLEMVIGSFFDSENSNYNFEKCMQYPVSNEMETRIQEFSTNSNKRVDSEIKTLLAKDATNQYTNTENINRARERLEELSQTYNASEEDINILKTELQKLTLNVKNTFDDFTAEGNELLENLKLGD
tara:strand:- start:954 stop:1466 length:513 start_codon:yes stop_codon:yes gene_type:complete